MSDPTALAAEARRAETPAADADLLARADAATHEHSPKIIGELAAALRRLTEDAKIQRQHTLDVYDSLGVKWGDDPFAAIGNLRAEVERLRVLAEAWESRATEHMARRYESERNAHALGVQLSNATARTTAAVEAMRERAAKVADDRANKPEGQTTAFTAFICQAIVADIRALPVDGGDALAERLRAEAVRALRWAWNPETRVISTEGHYVRSGLAALYPAPAGKETT